MDIFPEWSQFQVSSLTFGYYFFGQNGTPPFVMGRANPSENIVNY